LPARSKACYVDNNKVLSEYQLAISAPFSPARESRHFVIFISLSLLLQLVFLLVIRTPVTRFSSSPRKPLRVFFVAPPVTKSVHITDKLPKEKHAAPATILTSPDLPTIFPLEAARSEIITLPDTSNVLNLQQLLDSSHSIARDEARKTEQHSTVQEKEKLTTPAGSLEQYLKQPHKEIRLADGTLKIITAEGEVCFKPAPYFASGDIEKGVFRAVSTCP